MTNCWCRCTLAAIGIIALVWLYELPIDPKDLPLYGMGW